MSTAIGQRPRTPRDPSAAVRVCASAAAGLLGALIAAALAPRWLVPLAFRHALLSCIFGALIVSLTINLVAGLSK